MPRTALIDLDGTLADSAPELAAAVDRMLGDLGHQPVGIAKVREWIGGGIGALVARALAEALGREPDEDERKDARSRFDTRYAEVLGTMGPLYPGVVTGLDRLRAMSRRPSFASKLAPGASRSPAGASLTGCARAGLNDLDRKQLISRRVEPWCP